MQRRCIRTAVFHLLLVPAIGLAHDGHPRKPVAPEIVHKPTAVPDRIILTWTGDPTTTQAVTWRTDNSVEQGIAEIAIAGHGQKFTEDAKKLTAKTTPLETDLGYAHYHTVEFRNLKPETLYAYRVGDGVNWSEWIHFKTAAVEPKPFCFVYFGDAQNNIKSLWSRVVRQAFVGAPRAAFMLHAGDLISNANKDAEWGEWFYASAFIHRMVPCIATPGNHEYGKIKTPTGESRELSDHWRPTFAFPTHGPEGLEETCYYIDYQGARIISLNSNRKHEEQKRWLEKVLGDNPNKWTVIAFHHPIYSSKAGRDNVELREAWQPTFDKYRVDLVLTGHDHTYARSKQMTFEENVPSGVKKQSKEGGTVYVVSVSGPKMYDLGRRPFMMRAAEDTQLFQIITIDGNELRYEARTANDELYDAFTLQKRDGKPNRLIDQIPSTPEYRR